MSNEKIKLYVLKSYGNEIKEIEATRLTDKFYYMADGRRNAFITSFDCTFKTKQEAIDHRNYQDNRELNRLKKTIEHISKQLIEFNEINGANHA